MRLFRGRTFRAAASTQFLSNAINFGGQLLLPLYFLKVRNLSPDIDAIRALPLDVLVTARGAKADFVSRVFVPKYGIPEDPVTGSLNAGLRLYVGAGQQEEDGGYVSRVLAEQVHLRGVAEGKNVPVTVPTTLSHPVASAKLESVDSPSSSN